MSLSIFFFSPELLGTERWLSSQSCENFIFGVNSLLEVTHFCSFFWADEPCWNISEAENGGFLFSLSEAPDFLAGLGPHGQEITRQFCICDSFSQLSQFHMQVLLLEQSAFFFRYLMSASTLTHPERFLVLSCRFVPQGSPSRSFSDAWSQGWLGKIVWRSSSPPVSLVAHCCLCINNLNRCLCRRPPLLAPL